MTKPTGILCITAALAIGAVLCSQALVAAGAAKGNAAKGKALYAKVKCDMCHGANGQGDGPAGKAIKPPATDFTNGAHMEKRTDQQLFNATKNGGPAEKLAPTMPAYKDQIKDSEITDIVAYLRSLVTPAKK